MSRPFVPPTDFEKWMIKDIMRLRKLQMRPNDDAFELGMVLGRLEGLTQAWLTYKSKDSNRPQPPPKEKLLT